MSDISKIKTKMNINFENIKIPNNNHDKSSSIFSNNEIETISVKTGAPGHSSPETLNVNSNGGVSPANQPIYDFFKSFQGSMGSYGVDQGLISRLHNYCTFEIPIDLYNHLKTMKADDLKALGLEDIRNMNIYAPHDFSYNQMVEIMKICAENGIVPPIFDEYKTSEYRKLLDKLSSYGLTEIESEALLESINNGLGGCSYAETCNMIFSQFKDDPEKFKELFGFDMFNNKNGDKILNDAELMLDLYLFSNGGWFTSIQDMYEKNPGDFKQDFINFTKDPINAFFLQHVLGKEVVDLLRNDVGKLNSDELYEKITTIFKNNNFVTPKINAETNEITYSINDSIFNVSINPGKSDVNYSAQNLICALGEDPARFPPSNMLFGNKYLQSKEKSASYNVNKIVGPHGFFNAMNNNDKQTIIEVFKSQLLSNLNNGNSLYMAFSGIDYMNNRIVPILLEGNDPNSGNDDFWYTYGAHVVAVTGVDSYGIHISSEGKEYTISYNNLANVKDFEISSVDITY